MLLHADSYNAFVSYRDYDVPHKMAGSLANLNFAVKDIFDVAGYPTGCGSPEKMKDAVRATAHAPAVRNLLEAGAAFIGKTHTAELAFSLDGRNEHFGTPINPAAPDRVPGGSSSGSAVVVAGEKPVEFALGSDTGGSVRGPASFCGIIGLRPTFGRIDIAGVMPLAPSFDTVGWFARDIDVFERVGSVLLGEDVDGPPLSRMVVGYDAFSQLEGQAHHDALAPTVERAEACLKYLGLVTIAPGGLDAFQNVFRTIQGYEAWRTHGPWIMERKPELNPAVARRFEAASKVTETEYRAATARREQIRESLRSIVGEDCVLVIPTMPGIAPRLDASEDVFEAFRARALRLLAGAGLAGLPQLSLPVATFLGCPLGLSLIGPPGRDRALIALAGKILAG